MKKNIVSIGILIFSAMGLSLLVSLMGGTNAYAEPTFTCNYSGQNGGNRWVTEEGTYTGDLRYSAGNCVISKPTGENYAALNGKCTRANSKLHEDKLCWVYKDEVTNQKPTYVDGSAVPNETWQSMCGQERHLSGRQDRPLEYNSNNHRCEDSLAGCTMDSTSVYNNIAQGVCTTIDDSEKSLSLEDAYADPSKASRVNECTAAGRTWNAQKKDCNWDEKTCGQKDAGQGVWVNPPGECKAYSDFTNKEECVRIGGDFKLLDKAGTVRPDGTVIEQDRYECVKKGTNGSVDPNPNAPAECLRGPNKADGSPGDCINGSTFEKVTGKCGDARTNIISCEGQGGTALGNVLRIFVIVLSISIGIGAVGGLAYAAMLYAKAEDNSGNVSTARTLILNIVIGLFLYGFMLAIIQWLVPGGVIG